tara:strand:- start:1018 stop:1380 length:363 start_codon:yes stop_codon:yes gene_type:complete
MGKSIILLLLFLVLSMPSYGISKEAENLKYPSGVIYGFIDGCYLAFEDARYKSGELWPSELKEICACIMDGLREAIPLHEFVKEWTDELTPEQYSMSEMFGMICTEQIIKQKLQENKDPA